MPLIINPQSPDFGVEFVRPVVRVPIYIHTHTHSLTHSHTHTHALTHTHVCIYITGTGCSGPFFFFEKIHVPEEAALDVVIEEKLVWKANVCMGLVSSS